MNTLYDSLLNTEYLTRAWRRVRSSKNKRQQRTTRGLDDVSIADYEKDLSQNIASLQIKLQEKTYKMSPLKGFPIEKKGKPKDRLVMAPTIEDRIVQKAILGLIVPVIYPYINTGVSYCGIRKNMWKADPKHLRLNIKNVVVGIVRSLEQDNFYIFETDIKSFFDKIDKKLLISKVEEIFAREGDLSLLELIEQFVHFQLGNEDVFENNDRINLPELHVGISQGSSLSPILSNLYLSDFDQFISKVTGSQMIRYVDDLIVLGNSVEKVSRWGRIIEEQLLKLGLEIAKDKTNTVILKEHHLNFVGLKFCSDRITSKDDKGKIKKLFNEKYLSLGTYSKLNAVETSGKANSKIQGWANYYAPYHIEDIFKEVNVMIRNSRKTIRRFADIREIIPSKKKVITREKWRTLFK